MEGCRAVLDSHGICSGIHPPPLENPGAISRTQSLFRLILGQFALAFGAAMPTALATTTIMKMGSRIRWMRIMALPLLESITALKPQPISSSPIGRKNVLLVFS